MGETARESTTEHALGVVARIVGDGAKRSERELVSELPGSKVGIWNKTYLEFHLAPEGARCAIED